MSNPEIVDNVRLSFNVETQEITLVNCGDETVTIKLELLLRWLLSLTE